MLDRVPCRYVYIYVGLGTTPVRLYLCWIGYHAGTVHEHRLFPAGHDYLGKNKSHSMCVHICVESVDVYSMVDTLDGYVACL